jgi:flagellar basal-body rod modification protein FlgD
MQTHPLANQGTAGAAGGDSVSPSADVSATKDMFTKLLVAQIRNQDPLSPSDPSQFVNQLSQLSQTEALQTLTKSTTASASLLQSLQVLAMGGQVGAEVSVAAQRLQLAVTPVSGHLTLAAAGAPSVVLTGVDGRAHTVQLPFHAAGRLPFTIDPRALGLPPGSYAVAALGGDGAPASFDISGRIERVRMAGQGAVMLQVAGIGEVDPSSITGFNGKAGSEPATTAH